jgi:hypothetical protein
MEKMYNSPIISFSITVLLILFLSFDNLLVGQLNAGYKASTISEDETKPNIKLSNFYKSTDGKHEVKSVSYLVLSDGKRGKDLQLRIGFPEDEGSFPADGH